MLFAIGTDTNEFAGYRACKCLNNFYRTHLFEDCKPCDQPGLQCVHDFATLRSGYWWKWRNETDKMIYKTFTEGLKNAGVTPVVRTKNIASEGSYIEYPYSLPQPQKCPREKSCVGGLVSLCAVGYEGPLCEICSKGFHKQLKSCNKCPTKKWMIGQLSVLATVILVIIIIVVWTSRKKGKKNEERSSVDIILGRLKIAIGFYQVTSGVLEAFSYIKWPGSLTQIGEYSQVLQGNVFQIAPIQCLFENLKVNAFGSLYAILALNATAIIVAAAVYGIKKLTLMRNTLSGEVKVKEMSQTKEVIYRNLFFFLHVTYLSTCLKTANVLPLACHTICVDEEDEACEKFLKADYSIDCTSSEFNRSVFVAYCTVAYIVFVPTSFLIILWRQRSYQKQERGLSTGVSLQNREVLTGLRFLFENYTEQTWYWELVETIRKVVLTSGLILVGSESRAYVGLACVISGLYGMFFAYKRPILDSFENKLMLSSLGVTFVNLGIGAVSRIPKEGLPSSINPYLDNIIFNVLVFGANSLVIGLLLGKYCTPTIPDKSRKVVQLNISPF